MHRRIAVRGVAIIDGKILVVKQKPYRYSDASTYYCTPGGGLDDNEPLITGLEREMLEETGVPANVGHLLYIQQYKYGEQEHIEFFFAITNAQDYLNVDLSKTTHGLAEIEEISFVDPTTENVLPKFLQTIKLDDASFSTTQIYNYL